MFPTSVFLLTSHSHPFPITDRLVLIWLVPTGQVRLTEVAGTRAKEEKETKNIPHLPRSDRQTLDEVFTTYRSPSEEMWLCKWGCVLHSCVCPSSAFHLKKKKFLFKLLLFFFCLLAKKNPPDLDRTNITGQVGYYHVMCKRIFNSVHVYNSPWISTQQADWTSAALQWHRMNRKGMVSLCQPTQHW